MLQRSPEWYAVREGKLTASRVPAALGLDPYTSRPKLWRLLTGQEEPDPPSPRMDSGTAAEPHAIAAYEVATGYLTIPAGFVPHPSIAWLGASPDAFVEEGLVEVKCYDPTYWRTPKVVPAHHLAQMQAQMECTGRPWCDYWMWNHVTGERFFDHVERDRVWWQWAFSHLEEFWRCVEEKTPPARSKPRQEVMCEKHQPSATPATPTP